MNTATTIKSFEEFWAKTRKTWISAFLVFYFTINIILLLPNNPVKTQLAALVDPAWSFFDMNQNWSVYGPDLRRINFHSTATILYQDGSVRVLELPRPEFRSLFDKIRQEKFRKFASDTLPWPDHVSEFAPDTARYIARRNNLPGLTPSLITLRINWIETPRPSEHVSQSNLPPHTKQNTYFVYRVKPGDLHG